MGTMVVKKLNDKLVISIWSIGTFLVVMNTTMFNVSLPSIIHELQITEGLGSWIVSGYSIAFALSTIIFSRLSDFIPIRRLLFTGLSLLGIASVLGYASHHFGILLAARLLQASGAGAMPGLGMVLASRYIPFERRGRAVSMITSASALAFGLGPVAGGAITEFLGWNGLFLITCLVVPLVPVLWRLLPKESASVGRFDLVGAAWTIAATSTLLLALTQLSARLLLISAVSFALGYRHLSRVKEPFIQPVLFKNSGYRKLILVSFCALVLNMSMLFLMPLILANVFHKQAVEIGIMMFPGAILSAFLTRLVGNWIDQYGNYRFMFWGHLLLASAMLLVTVFIGWSAYTILAAYLLFAPSFSAVMSALSTELSRILPKEHIGAGMGLAQLLQFFGGSFSVAACGLLIVWQKNIPAVHAYQHIYMLLFMVVTVSFLNLLWYRKSSRGVDLQQNSVRSS